MKSKWLVALGLVFIVLLVLGACRTPAPPPQPAAVSQTTSEWDKVMEAAKKEGTITVYESAFNPQAREEIAKALTDKFGIKVEYVIGRGPESYMRIQAEQQAGNYVADAFSGGMMTSYSIFKEGYTEPVLLPAAAEKNVWRLNPYDLDPKGGISRFLFYPEPSGLANTKLIQPQDEPTSWTDLLKPQWKGKMAWFDPSIPGPAAMVFYQTVQTKALGADYYRKLADQDILLLPRGGYQQLAENVAAGTRPLGIAPPVPFVMPAIKAGAPLKFLVFKDGTHTASLGAGIVKRAPHPNAAKVYVNFLMTKEGHIIISKTQGVASSRTDVPVGDWVPEAGRFYESVPFWIETEAALNGMQEALKLGENLFRK